MPVHYRDEEDYKKKVDTVRRRGGFRDLKIIADFDYTLSRLYDDDGERCASCFMALESLDNIPEAVRVKAQEMKDYYFPIEIDPNVSQEDKYKAMEEWFQNAHKNLLESGVRKDDMRRAAEGVRMMLRPGVKEFAQTAATHKIPFMVFSAGIGNIIQEVFMHNNIGATPNLHVESNWMLFDHHGDGTICGWTEPGYHVMNKDARNLQKAPYFEDSEHRRSVLLLGDSLSDLKMSNGASYDTQISIGFLNEKVEERMASYMDKFDVVITPPDVSYDFVNELVEGWLQTFD
eukprot:PhM_4_TR7211/c1_g1_i1/m.89953/K01081/E3.1.3.5; 5'-nucleotidase